jgi:chromatin segregation and condensation protein Rec8/ScpA/Scc1 (kleisin family)
MIYEDLQEHNIFKDTAGAISYSKDTIDRFITDRRYENLKPKPRLTQREILEELMTRIKSIQNRRAYQKIPIHEFAGEIVEMVAKIYEDFGVKPPVMRQDELLVVDVLE